MADFYIVQRHDKVEEERYEIFMEALKFKDMDLRRAAIGAAYAETCQWIFKNQDYNEWRKIPPGDQQCALLWIRGKPGSGKSTLMKCIMEHLQKERHDHVVTFFFNARGRELLGRSAAGCYRSLLYQLLKLDLNGGVFEVPDLPSKGTDWPVEIIQDSLRQALLRLETRQAITIMVDALDECEAPEIRDMVNFLIDLSEESRRKATNLRVCFASRHFPNITARSCTTIVLEGQEAHHDGIKEYIQDNLHVHDASKKTTLGRTIMKKSAGVFMWVVLVLKSLNEQSDRGATINEESLSVLPSSLHDLYQKIVSDAISDPFFLPIMLWTLVGYVRSLSLDQFCYAVSHSTGETTSPFRDQMDRLNQREPLE